MIEKRVFAGLAWCLGFVIWCLLIPSIGAQESVPWWDRKWPVRLLIKAEQKENTGFASLKIDYNGHMREDGTDFRLVNAKGREVPLLIFPDSPKGLFLLAFPVRGRDYYLYYGNPKAEAGKSWSPDRGLLLATFAHTGAGTGSAADFKKLLKDRKYCCGRDFVPAVFHGANPFGPSDNYLSVYSGYFQAKQKGAYILATASDDASFMYVDKEPVLAWAGRHGVWGGHRGQHRATLNLDPGPHSFRYNHIEYTSGQVAAAYIQRPGEKRLDVLRFPLPDKVFIKDAETEDHSYEPVISIRERGEIQAGGLYLVAVDFQAAAGAQQYEWETGDGSRYTGRKIQHVYLREGEYPIVGRFTAAGKTHTVSIKRRITFNGQRPDLAKKMDVPKLLFGYDYSAMGAKAFGQVLAYAAARDIIPPASFLKTGEALLATCSLDTLLALVDLHCNQTEDLTAALAAVAKGLERFARKEERARLLVKQGDIHFYFQKDYRAAISAYREVTKNPFLKGWGDYRLAFIRLGDVYRQRNRGGDFDLAMVYYSRAEDLNVNAHDALKNGYYTHAVLDLIGRKQYGDALAKLEEWEFNYPTEKLGGFSSLQRARINFLNKQFEETEKQALTYISMNPATTYLADFFMLIGAANYRREKYDRARLYYGKVLDQCPESPKGEKAREMLEKLKNR